jgi:spermidine synthase
VLSVFMAGLAIGSWAAGRLASGRAARRSVAAFLGLYAIAEIAIGAAGLLVPIELEWGRQVLGRVDAGVAWGSASYYVASGFWIGVILLPPCLAMGATIPFAMAAIRASGQAGGRAFSFLYLANVVGAAVGTLASAFVLIEVFGFRGTVTIAAILNALLATAALGLSLVAGRQPAHIPELSPASAVPGDRGEGLLLWGLFLTGAVSLALEVVWVRQFTPFLGTLVYAFATILAVYLVATLIGSKIYRVWAAGREIQDSAPAVLILWMVLAVAGLLPLVSTDLRLSLTGVARLVIGIAPFCAVAGFLTPMLVDRWSGGDPGRAGLAYGVNVVGSILGPVLASFALLPALGERSTEFVLALPLLATVLFALVVPSRLLGLEAVSARRRIGPVLAVGFLVTIILVGTTQDFEEAFPRREVRRDYTATVIAFGEGMQRQMLVNGVGMTSLTPITKMMAHLPLAALGRPPQDGLVIAFGTGTSFGSMLSWGIPTTVIELVPSVPQLIGYYHVDGPNWLRSPLARVIIDDGRRFLERTSERYDVITIDPPPPVEAAGSSLLYSREFYAIAAKRLRDDGVLQQWFPGGETAILTSVARALTESFPHVRVFKSLEDWGFHFLASRRPLGNLSAAELGARLPGRAAADMLEWGPHADARAQFGAVLEREVVVDVVLALVPWMPAVQDNRPTNEYFLIRRALARLNGAPVDHAR